jgi:uncharacterized membrane protein (UPF0127 family)
MPLSPQTWRATVAALSILGMACTSRQEAPASDQYAGLVAFDTARIRLHSARDTTTITAELAESSTQHTMGLMERRALPADAGMLFLYPGVQSATSAFWMFRTRIPLDIAFIDSVGAIRTITAMVPCPTSLPQGCPEYAAGARYVAALEANAGYFAAKHLRVGDRVMLGDTVTRRRSTKPTP